MSEASKPITELKLNGHTYKIQDSQSYEEIQSLKNKIGAKNGIASLDKDGRVPIEQLPSYVDDVVEVNSELIEGKIVLTDKKSGEKISVGEKGKIYIDQNGTTYRSSDEQFVEIVSVTDLANELIKREDNINASVEAIEIWEGAAIDLSQEVNDSDDSIPSSKAIKDYVDGKVKDVDLTDYATKEYVNNAIANVKAGADEEEVKAIIADYLEENGSETEDLTIESTITESDNIPTSSAVIKYVQEEITKTQTGEKIDLSNYYTKDEIDSKGYLTEHQDISGKANVSDVYTKQEVQELIANAITTTLNEEV